MTPIRSSYAPHRGLSGGPSAVRERCTLSKEQDDAALVVPPHRLGGFVHGTLVSATLIGIRLIERLLQRPLFSHSGRNGHRLPPLTQPQQVAGRTGLELDHAERLPPPSDTTHHSPFRGRMVPPCVRLKDMDVPDLRHVSPPTDRTLQHRMSPRFGEVSYTICARRAHLQGKKCTWCANRLRLRHRTNGEQRFEERHRAPKGLS